MTNEKPEETPNIGQQFDWYRDSHKPDSDGAPLHDLTANETFPKDVYDTLHYYDGSQEGNSHIRRLRNKPDSLVTIYRAVPKDLSEHTDIKTRLNQTNKELSHYKAKGKTPTWWQQVNGTGGSGTQAGSDFYEWATDTSNKLSKHLETTKPVRVKSINHGDWVSIDRRYAVEHGEGRFNGKYTILSKQVPAKHVRNAGNDLNEWGYFPEG